ncbi:MAG: hypothetical protein V4570_00190 [Pseudomonadota bacterium]
MSVAQYLRKASLIVGQNEASRGAIDLSELCFRFSVKRGDIQTPNTADIRVYNVSEQTAQAVEREFERVVLQAGYEGGFGIIFDGQIKQVRRGRESQTDTFIDITCADGDSAYNFSVSAFSLAAGSTPKDAVSEILKDMAERGISKGFIPDLPGNPLPRGKIFYGMSKDKMREIAKNTNTSWSIQDGKLQMVPLTTYMPGEIPVLTGATGVIGLPEQTQNGIRLKVLLNPAIKIGQAVKLDNASIQKFKYSLSITQEASNLLNEQSNKINNDGLYYVMIADHTGDTRGNEFYTDLTCLAIDAAVPRELLPQAAVRGDIGPIKRRG